MAINNLSDEELKKMLDDPEAYLKDKSNLDRILGFDSAAKRRFADILKYELNLDDNAIKAKLDQVAAVRLKEVDVWS